MIKPESTTAAALWGLRVLWFTNDLTKL